MTCSKSNLVLHDHIFLKTHNMTLNTALQQHLISNLVHAGQMNGVMPSHANAFYPPKTHP